METLSNKPHIIIFTETRIIDSLDTLNFLHLKGYKTYYNESEINICDGVVTYVIASLDHNSIISVINELKILKITIKINSFCVIISALYRSHNITKNIFNNLIESYLSQNCNLNNNHFIIGDFNMNIIDEDYENNNILRAHIISWVCTYNKFN